jgi:hypothetical protein
VRWLLLAILINGLAPGIAEAGEAVVHYVQTGHLAHSPGEEDLDDQGPEHSCGVVFHQCGCCTAMTVLPHDGAGAGEPAPMVERAALVNRTRVVTRSLEPPLRPPIR